MPLHDIHPIEVTPVRNNLMTQKGYSPYCGADRCFLTWPRTTFNGEQFKCLCDWVSQFPKDFINKYKTEWGIK